jgi:DNA-binding transcriptional ArsR family regulator
MVKKIFLILFLLFSNLILAQSISASASVDSTTYLVGDYIQYKVRVNYDKSIKLVPPAIQDSLKKLELIKVSSPVYSEKDGKKTVVYSFVLSKYDSADVTIPPINIYYRVGKDTLNNSGVDTTDVALKSVQANPVQFAVRLVKVNLQKDIKDVKEPQKIPLDLKLILLWVLIGLIVLATLFYLYRRYKKKKAGIPIVKKVIKLPSHVIALNSLRALDEKKLWQSGKIKEYHSEITEIIRRYFSERFGLHALELTTSETMQLLRTTKETEIIRDITENFLNNADMVKFAKFSPMSSVNEEMMKQANEIVEKTIPKAEPKIEQEAENV